MSYEQILLAVAIGTLIALGIIKGLTEMSYEQILLAVAIGTLIALGIIKGLTD